MTSNVISSILALLLACSAAAAADIRRVVTALEHGDAEQSDAHEEAGHRTHDGPLRFDLQSNQICAVVVPPTLNGGTPPPPRNADPRFLVPSPAMA
jgi:hypothetical protein